VDDAQYDRAIYFLHLTGDLFHFSSSTTLKQTLFISPAWVFKQMNYFLTIIDNQKNIPLQQDEVLIKFGREIIKVKKGKIEINKIPSTKEVEIIKQFRICLEIKNPHSLMFPSLLQPLPNAQCIPDKSYIPEKEFEKWISSSNDSLNLKFFGRKLVFNENNLVPHSFHSLLQVYLHDTIISEHYFWRNGDYFICGSEQCIFWFAPQNEYVNICIRGKNPAGLFRRLNIIIEQFIEEYYPGFHKKYSFDYLCYCCIEKKKIENKQEIK